MTAHVALTPAGEAPPPADLAAAATGGAAPNPLVPVRARHDGWTPARQRAFLEALADGGSVRDACAIAGMSETAAYALRRRPDAAAFAAAWDAALALTLDRLTATAVDRALNGTVKRLYYHGQLVAEERVYSDRLLTFLIAKGAALLGGRGDPTRFDSELGGLDNDGFRVWRDPENGDWMTNFPPPRRFDNWSEGSPFTAGYQRCLSPAEERGMDARAEGAAANEARSRAEAARDRFFSGDGGAG